MQNDMTGTVIDFNTGTIEWCGTYNPIHCFEQWEIDALLSVHKKSLPNWERALDVKRAYTAGMTLNEMMAKLGRFGLPHGRTMVALDMAAFRDGNRGAKSQPRNPTPLFTQKTLFGRQNPSDSDKKSPLFSRGGLFAKK